MREAGLSNRFCPSVVCRLSVRRRKLKSHHIDPHKPSKWSQTIANSKKNCSMCTWLKSRRSVWLYFGYFLLFITIHNRAPPLRDLKSPIKNRTCSAFGNLCFEMTARKQCLLTIYVLHGCCGYCFGCFFQLFPIIRNILLHLSS